MLEIDLHCGLVHVCKVQLFGELRQSWVDNVLVVECQCACAASIIVEHKLGELQEVHHH
jgi:hypothetical protein